MKKGIKGIILGVATLSVLGAGMAACGGPRGPWGHGHWGGSEEDMAARRVKMVERISDKLDLNAGQKEKLNALADAMTEQRKALRGDNDLRTDFGAVIAGSTFDRAKAQSLVEQKIAAVQAHSPNVLDRMQSFYDSLTPRQQQKVRDKLADGRGGKER